MLEDFQRIAQSKKPHMVQEMMVTPDQAQAVIESYTRLGEPFRARLLTLPVANIIEFSQINRHKATAKSAGTGFKAYLRETEAPPAPVVTQPEPIPAEMTDVPDAPVAEPEPAPITEAKPVEVKKPKKRATEAAKPNTDDAVNRVLERIETISNNLNKPLAVTVATTEAHVDRLYEIEKSMLATLVKMSERVSHTADDSKTSLLEMVDAQRSILEMHRTMMDRICETQTRLAETQTAIVSTMAALVEKVDTLAQTMPVVNPVINVPAPIVNVTTTEGRRMTTKMVERDERGLITKITEGYECDEN